MKSYEELNAWLLNQCVAHAEARRHPELREQVIWQVFEAERPALCCMPRFDWVHAVPASVSMTYLGFDNSKYSATARVVGWPVETRAYAGRIELRQGGRSASIAAILVCDQTVFDPAIGASKPSSVAELARRLRYPKVSIHFATRPILEQIVR